jgi:hypothetical protein
MLKANGISKRRGPTFSNIDNDTIRPPDLIDGLRPVQELLRVFVGRALLPVASHSMGKSARPTRLFLSRFLLIRDVWRATCHNGF